MSLVAVFLVIGFLKAVQEHYVKVSKLELQACFVVTLLASMVACALSAQRSEVHFKCVISACCLSFGSFTFLSILLLHLHFCRCLLEFYIALLVPLVYLWLDNKVPL